MRRDGATAVNYYPRYVGDYQRDTSGLSLTEHGVYTQLLDCYYSREQPLPPELDRLCRIARAMEPFEREAVRVVADEFFPLAEDGLRHNRRADEEIAEWQRFSGHQRELSRKGVEARKRNASDTSRSTDRSTHRSTKGLTSKQQGGEPVGTTDGSTDGLTDGLTPPPPPPPPQSTSNSTTTQEKTRARGTDGLSDGLTDGEMNGEDEERYDPPCDPNGHRAPLSPESPFTPIRKAYPRGIYAAGNWILAEREAYRRVEDEGVTSWEELLAGVQRYARQCDAKGSTGTQFVLSPEKFFAKPGGEGAPLARWLEAYPLPEKRSASAADRVDWRPSE
jgi:uncharacterized protein YdaU (DUF1376 family)